MLYEVITLNLRPAGYLQGGAELSVHQPQPDVGGGQPPVGPLHGQEGGVVDVQPVDFMGPGPAHGKGQGPVHNPDDQKISLPLRQFFGVPEFRNRIVLRQDHRSGGHRSGQGTSTGLVDAAEGRKGRITSYNVCYTKLLRHQRVHAIDRQLGGKIDLQAVTVLNDIKSQLSNLINRHYLIV